MGNNPQSTPGSPKPRLDGRALIWVLLVVAAIGLIGFPFYREHLRSTVPSAEAADQTTGTTTSEVDIVQIPTRLAYHTNGTVSVRFQGQPGNTYRIDYADTKTATPETMRWQVAADGVIATNGWTEWVDAGETNRSAPGEVYERYYRVVLGTASSPITTATTGETATEESTGALAGSVTISSPQTPQATEAGGTALPEPRSVQELQAYARLGELVAGGPAMEEALKQTLATSNLHSRDLMELGRNLFLTGYRRSAELIFEAIVNHQAPRGLTPARLARSYLWLAKIHEDQAQEFKYELRNLDQARPEYETAIADYLAAKDISRDWVRAHGWMQAAGCYRELGDQEKRRECLQHVLAEPKAEALFLDMATYQIANSYYEQDRWDEAANVYLQMQKQLSIRFPGHPEEYSGQRTYIDLARTGLAWCTDRQAEQQAIAGPPVVSEQAKGQVAP
jgi:tetratricopeptide (TPR) repeat protein